MLEATTVPADTTFSLSVSVSISASRADRDHTQRENYSFPGEKR